MLTNEVAGAGVTCSSATVRQFSALLDVSGGHPKVAACEVESRIDTITQQVQ